MMMMLPMLTTLVILLQGELQIAHSLRAAAFLRDRPSSYSGDFRHRHRQLRIIPSRHGKTTISRPTTTKASSSCLFSSPSSSSGNSSKLRKQPPSSTVVYQKVIRPPPTTADTGNGDALFLGYLVEYLQSVFQLPDRLSMPYEKEVVGGDEGDRSLVRIDSPLSPSPLQTRLDIEVVGIFADDGSDVPNMAMVVVKKGKRCGADSGNDAAAAMPPMLRNLFADSEERILKSLELGLEDFAAGRIEFGGSSDNGVADISRVLKKKESRRRGGRGNDNFKAQSEAILAEIVDDDDDEEDKKGDGVSDALDDSKDSERTRGDDKLLENSVSNNLSAEERVDDESDLSKTAKSKSPTQVSAPEDYAVAAAKAKREAARRRSSEGGKADGSGAISTASGTVAPDFAVQAARKVAASRRGGTRREKGTTESREGDKDDDKDIDNQEKSGEAQQQLAADGSSPLPPSSTASIERIDYSSIRPPILDPDNSPPRAFIKTVSKPGDYLKRRANKKTSTIKSRATSTPDPVDTKKGEISKATKRGEATKSILVGRDETSNAEESTSGPAEDTISEDGDEAIQRQILRQTEEALTELESQSPDMTPEQLLEKVMKFGDEKQREESVGGAFVSGAFEKAKDLLREQKQMRDERLTQQVAQKVSTDFKEKNAVIPEVKDLTSPDEEIRKMFEAGERLAEGRIAVATTTGVVKAGDANSMSQRDQETVDSLIAGDNEVSRNTRILDEELAELEVRINKSPDESFDGPRKNKLFDIFSGPEVYNPNVDPETAVNWPGAQPGTRDTKLPKELSEAVKQAEFAAEVLSKLEVREADPSQDDETVSEKQYFVGDRELSQEQVDKLRTLLKESIEIGLIGDPLTVMAERSRLQMLLDELWDQPEERLKEIASNYKDLLLSDNFVPLIKERLSKMADEDLDALRRDDDSLEETHARERDLLGTMVGYAQLLLKEARALGAELEAQQLEVIRSICKVAMDPSHATEEDAALALTDAVRDMRPLFDDAFVAYLKYAVSEEEGRLARAGLLDDPEHNQWLFVLKIVQQGVYAELARGINRYIDHIFYVLRMETQVERRMLLKKLIDVMPTLDVRPFVQVVDNIAGSLGDSVSGDFDGTTELGEMTNKVLQLRRDVHELLPPERIALMSRDADEWAEQRRKRLMEQRKLTQQRLEASRQTEHLDQEIEAIGRRGEIERIE